MNLTEAQILAHMKSDREWISSNKYLYIRPLYFGNNVRFSYLYVDFLWLQALECQMFHCITISEMEPYRLLRYSRDLELLWMTSVRGISNKLAWLPWKNEKFTRRAPLTFTDQFQYKYILTMAIEVSAQTVNKWSFVK